MGPKGMDLLISGAAWWKSGKTDAVVPGCCCCWLFLSGCKTKEFFLLTFSLVLPAGTTGRSRDEQRWGNGGRPTVVPRLSWLLPFPLHFSSRHRLSVSYSGDSVWNKKRVGICGKRTPPGGESYQSVSNCWSGRICPSCCCCNSGQLSALAAGMCRRTGPVFDGPFRKPSILCEASRSSPCYCWAPGRTGQSPLKTQQHKVC